MEEVWIHLLCFTIRLFFHITKKVSALLLEVAYDNVKKKLWEEKSRGSKLLDGFG